MPFRNDVLSVLWSGKGTAVSEDEAGVFGMLFRAFFPARSILVGVADGALGERVLLDDTEVMPSLSLGDVLAEELNIIVPYGTPIVFVPRAALHEGAPRELRGETLGRIYAQVIQEAVSTGSFPMQRELQIILCLCMSAVATAARLDARTGRISCASFERALASSIDRLLCGRSSGRADLTIEALRDLYCAECPAELGPPIIAFFPMSFEHWLSAVSPKVDQKASTVMNPDRAPKLRSSEI
ncbi:hypothetical protein P6F26_09385 [Roseibacterium sp. SDUM158017]|uniref:hypothetical protein n=1 Tax=Roseicyclus salinarum TaxID=3036773 RepID=UPI002414EB41|nr:hypothetical protein [Roseibacterium sp. SDUM158017]MDG4648659.1 hypothetical protein [Roseibacterium sp. SDUM158017]